VSGKWRRGEDIARVISNRFEVFARGAFPEAEAEAIDSLVEAQNTRAAILQAEVIHLFF
jgi:hypothetical protein